MMNEKAESDQLTTDVGSAHSRLARIVLSEQPLGAVLGQVARITADLVPGADEVSITMIERDRARSVAFNGRLAATLDERQYQAGFGPCMDAAVTGQVITIEDTSNEETYPDFAHQAARAGVRHTLSIGLPVVVQGRTGAMNLYAGERPIEPGARDLAVGFASYAAVAVTNAAVYAGALDEVEQMQAAMASRSVIEQAKGILMAAHHCDADTAFGILREASSRANRKLRDIAQSLVDTTISPS